MKYAPLLLLLACAPGLRAQSAAPADTLITADGDAVTTQTDTGTEFVVRDNVVVDSNGLHLTCDVLTVEADKMSPAQAAAGPAAQLQKARLVVATGRVVKIVDADYVATCGHAEMFPQENRVVLTENPVVHIISSDSTFSSAKVTLQKNAQGHWVTSAQGGFKGNAPNLGVPELAAPKADGGTNGAPPVAPPPIKK